MKTYENLRGKRADVRGRQVRANKILSLLSPFGSLLFPSPPFYLLTASQPLYPFLPRELSRGCTSPYLHVPLSQREEKKPGDAGETLSCANQKLDCRNELKVDSRLLGINARGRSRGSFAFQLADSFTEGTLSVSKKLGKMKLSRINMRHRDPLRLRKA